ncbi:hypothetical protein WHZ78_23715 [Bradyrhizobium symbiodeficiens]|uniref:hypothetical protein n=1 Tax=Bradyrhizobium symbiodeficiens TaxID=1404367 RepID=UPI0030D515D6
MAKMIQNWFLVVFSGFLIVACLFAAIFLDRISAKIRERRSYLVEDVAGLRESETDLLKPIAAISEKNMTNSIRAIVPDANHPPTNG